MVQIDDLTEEPHQVNLPGTTDQHPNWRRRLPDTVAALIARPDVAARAQAIAAGRAR
jgi:4-alpha-glucanotransferase